MNTAFESGLCFALGQIKRNGKYYYWWRFQKSINIDLLRNSLTVIFKAYEEYIKHTCGNKHSEYRDFMYNHMCAYMCFICDMFFISIAQETCIK